jgi:hypothetical protein
MSKTLAAALILVATATAASAADRLPRSGTPTRILEASVATPDYRRPHAGGVAPRLFVELCGRNYRATPHEATLAAPL